MADETLDRSYQALTQLRCLCGRFAIFLRYGSGGGPYEVCPVVNCKRCGEVTIR